MYPWASLLPRWVGPAPGTCFVLWDPDYGRVFCDGKATLADAYVFLDPGSPGRDSVSSFLKKATLLVILEPLRLSFLFLNSLLIGLLLGLTRFLSITFLVNYPL
mmetsp:Transcript_33238/g.50969  ORF Transcript_33238/g.50969 Transcript_33238/m.50969 type:complete len:104 (+) Transcript_33238:1643-1954(+)